MPTSCCCFRALISRWVRSWNSIASSKNDTTDTRRKIESGTPASARATTPAAGTKRHLFVQRTKCTASQQSGWVFISCCPVGGARPHIARTPGAFHEVEPALVAQRHRYVEQRRCVREKARWSSFTGVACHQRAGRSARCPSVACRRTSLAPDVTRRPSVLQPSGCCQARTQRRHRTSPATSSRG